MPKNALGIMDLSSGQVARVERVKNFQVPEDASGFIAYSLEAKPGAAPNREATDSGAPKEPPAGSADVLVRNHGKPNERADEDVRAPSAAPKEPASEQSEDGDAAQRPQGGGGRPPARGP